MRAYGSTFSAMTMSDVDYGDGCFGEPTRTNRIKSKNRVRGRRSLHKLGRKEASIAINQQIDDGDEGYLYEE